MDVKETTCYLPTHDQLVQSVNNTRNALNSVVESTSKLLYLYSKVGFHFVCLKSYIQCVEALFECCRIESQCGYWTGVGKIV